MKFNIMQNRPANRINGELLACAQKYMLKQS